MGSITRYIFINIYIFFFFGFATLQCVEKTPQKKSPKWWDLMSDVHPMGSQSVKNHIKHIQVFHWANVEVILLIFCFYLENIRNVSYILG